MVLLMGLNISNDLSSDQRSSQLGVTFRESKHQAHTVLPLPKRFLRNIRPGRDSPF
jgi:hypothetical protein